MLLFCGQDEHLIEILPKSYSDGCSDYNKFNKKNCESIGSKFATIIKIRVNIIFLSKIKPKCF